MINSDNPQTADPALRTPALAENAERYAPLRVGLVGTGWVAHQHVAGYKSVSASNVAVVAACDPREDVLEEFASRYSIPGRYVSATEMLEREELDAVVLLTPPAIRDEVIYPALERGKHLLIEKPFAVTGAKAAEYVTAADAAGVQLAVSQNFRWFPEMQWLASRLRSRDAGTPRYIDARSFQNRPQQPGVWRANESKLEMAIFSIHLIDRIQWLAPGAPTFVRAVTRRNVSSGLPGEQFTSLSVEFDDDMVADMVSSWMSIRLPLNDLRVDTDTGSASVSRTHPMSGEAIGAAHFSGSEPEYLQFQDSENDTHSSQSYGGSMHAFAHALRTGQPAAHSGRNNLRTMGIMEAAYLSADRGGAPVHVEEALGPAWSVRN
ncbi:putative dehydrogenase [Pseudarthrobacter phenanthrenivorans Sphe3]|uniref:Putative dehydrogenase n=2 Tax=Pseudarthrobacter phenanthrenivorans TaxID=361575 RepID=F0M4K9_PSEPM|nr:putative dehydrogenase [Pseudarthrobacter phenanthrenivorans Sphe3]